MAHIDTRISLCSDGIKKLIDIRLTIRHLLSHGLPFNSKAIDILEKELSSCEKDLSDECGKLSYMVGIKEEVRQEQENEKEI